MFVDLTTTFVVCKPHHHIITHRRLNKPDPSVPISSTAAALALPTHVFDTFTGFTPPFAYNLVVAVSFGLLVPPRILAAARYGGLNVHPSLLPDLRGSAPIEHAILKQRSHTGVSVQTLHPQRFDEGVVLAQTPSPGIPISADDTAAVLEPRLAALGADMLVDVLKEGKFLDPVQDASWFPGPTDYAPKITKQHRFLDFSTMHMPNILAVQRALGDMWCLLPNGERLVLHDVVDTGSMQEGRLPGLALDEAADRELLFRDAVGRVGIVRSSTYPGGARGKGNSKVLKLLRDDSTPTKLK